MTDMLSRTERSERMSKIRGRNTKPEMAIRRELHRAGLRYRLHSAGLPGRPDIVFSRSKVAIFIHGCFWHRHHHFCSATTTPKSNTQYWQAKFRENQLRDRRVQRQLKGKGWEVIVIWQCELKTKDKLETTARSLIAKLHQFTERSA
jgi:DNA mismatch endonuclease (patch repair protein)